MLEHSVTAYLADVDPARAAEGFRTQESDDIANLAEVPLSSWRYEVRSAVTDPTVRAASAKRYGVPALVLRVRLYYALRYVDVRPSQQDLWLSFVRRDGRTYLAGDDDVAAAGSRSWAGPWRYGPLAAVRGARSLVLGPAGEAAQLPALARSVDAAVPAVTAVWGTDWNQQIAVVVSSSPAEFGALVGSDGILDVSAAAVTAGIDPVSRAPYGQRLLLAPDTLARLSAVGQRIVLRHELTHLATAASTADTTPRWLVEGFAEYVGNLGSGQAIGVAAAELRAAVAAGRVPTALPGDAEFSASGPVLARAYEQAWLACVLIARRAGERGLVGFYRMVATALLPPAPAVEAAMRSVLHESSARFTAQWRAYLQAELR